MGDLNAAMVELASETSYEEDKRPALHRTSFYNFSYSTLPGNSNVATIFGNNVPDSLRIWAFDIVSRSLYSEIGNLIAMPAFGKYDQASIEPTSFDATLEDAASTILRQAPMWMSLFATMKKRHFKPTRSDELTDTQSKQLAGKLILVISTLCQLRHPQNCDNLPTKLGICFFQAGLSKQGLDLLGHLYVCSSYKTINRRQRDLETIALEQVRRIGRNPTSIVTYNNFEFRQGKRVERIGDQADFRSITTGLVIPSRVPCQVPLTRDMWKPKQCLLGVSDIMAKFPDGSRLKQDVGQKNEISYNLKESDTHRLYYSTFSPVSRLIQDAGINWPIEEPVMERLPPCKTKPFPIQPIMKDQNSNENNIFILEDIYRRQFNMKDDQLTFRSGLRMTSGDQKTWARMISAAGIPMETSENISDLLTWNFPMLGLWHYRYNLVDLLHQVQMAATKANKPSKKTPNTRGRATPIDTGLTEDDSSGTDGEEDVTKRPIDITSLQFAANRWGRSRVTDSSNFQAVEQVSARIHLSHAISSTIYTFCYNMTQSLRFVHNVMEDRN